jgi:hypothetical protein
MGENVLESDPSERSQKKNQLRKNALYFGKKPGKKGPEKSKITNKN